MKNILFHVVLVAAFCGANATCGYAAEGVKTLRVTDFGAKGDGKKDNTKAINKAIAKAPRGAVVEIPAGRFVTGTIRLKSDITLQIDEGAEVIGSGNLENYECYNPLRDMSKYDTGAGTRNANITSDKR